MINPEENNRNPITTSPWNIDHGQSRMIYIPRESLQIPIPSYPAVLNDTCRRGLFSRGAGAELEELASGVNIQRDVEKPCVDDFPRKTHGFSTSMILCLPQGTPFLYLC